MRINLFFFFLIFSTTCNGQYDTTGAIDERFMRAVIEIDNTEGTGSGFLLQGGDQMYLVTNKHMIGSWTPVDAIIFFDSITINLYPSNITGNAVKISIPISIHGNPILRKVKIHPNPKIDIAIINITEEVEHTDIGNTFFLDTAFLLDLSTAKNVLSYGSHVFAIGYPAGAKSYKTNLPLAKSGYISSSLNGDLVMMQTWINRSKVPVTCLSEGKIFIVDGLIIPGNSGGPVLIPKETIWRKIGGKDLHFSPAQNSIIGIISNIYNGTGLATVFSADNIKEVLRQ